MDRYSFAILIANVFGLDKTLISPIDTPSLGQKAKRPLRAGLMVEKIEKDAGIKMIRAREGLMIVKEKLKAMDYRWQR